jgi:uncharacterized protein YkwD
MLAVPISAQQEMKYRARNLFRVSSDGTSSSSPSAGTSGFMITSESNGNGSGAPRRNRNSFDAYQQEMLAEVNFARTNPSGYAEKYLAPEAAKNRDNGAYAELSKRKPVKPLTLESRLCSAAEKYARYMAENNVFGHNQNGTFSERIHKEGYEYRSSGENIACGTWENQNGFANPALAARTFVLQLVIDMGVPDSGHRKNILSTEFTELGAGFWQNRKSDYVNYTVQDFGKPE